MAAGDRLLDELAWSFTADDVALSRLAEVSARLRVAGVRLDALRWSVLPRIEAGGLWAQSGARPFAVRLARVEDVRTGTAKRDVRTARALRDHLPATTSPVRTQALGAPAVWCATSPAMPTPRPTSTATS